MFVRKAITLLLFWVDELPFQCVTTDKVDSCQFAWQHAWQGHASCVERKLSSIQICVPPSGLETRAQLRQGGRAGHRFHLGPGQPGEREGSSTNLLQPTNKRQIRNVWEETGKWGTAYIHLDRYSLSQSPPPPTLSDHKHNFQSTCR